MQIIRHDMDKLAQARELQARAKDLHLVPSPIVTWGARVYDPDGEQVADILAKSNSYTRNALNVIACQSTWCRRGPAGAGQIGGGFADGQLGGKDTAGNVYNSPYFLNQYSNSAQTATGETEFSLLAGYSDSAESIDSYVLGNEFGTGTSVNQLTKGTSAKSTVWDSANRKFITTISRQFTNGYGSSQIIREIGLTVRALIADSNPHNHLMLRDVLSSPITLTSGQTVILYYQLEALIN